LAEDFVEDLAEDEADFLVAGFELADFSSDLALVFAAGLFSPPSLFFDADFYLP